MVKLRDISIRNKLVLMQVFTSVLVLGIFFAVYVVTDVKSYKQRKADSILSLAQVIGTNSISPLRFFDNESARQMLAEVHNISPEIVYASIVDAKGKLFASYPKSNSGNVHLPPSLSEKNSVFSGNYLFVRYDITSDGESMGKVVFQVELSELEQIKQSKYNIATALLFIALGFSFLIALAIQTYVSRRLLNLVNTMKDVSRTGDYTKSIMDDGRDEISTLVNVFNSLMQHIKTNQQKKDEFISIVSHELKTPLTSIKGYLQLIEDMEDRQPNKQFVRKGLENVKKLELLIRDLLDVSKIQSGQLQLNIGEFNMAELLDETIATTKMVSGTHEILWENQLRGEMVFADRHRIEQVLTNLLSNAVKYSPGENRIIVSSKKTDSEIVIKIRDFGIGVPREERQNIFERFYRSKDMSATIVGFGLGLYICRDIISRHSGRIWVEQEDKGSAFYFTLPLERMTEFVAAKPVAAKAAN